uniref:Cytochrome c oxidase subunit 2 n=1 Tax=Gregariella coralliophaga TaxID=2590089 RepID=A0A516EZG7_9BIVA|nr:cytochrome c oxidase subunit II [Gregariella coralliophaga]QDO71898.1 cytochrome c oxidase subunit II [Gregariella coralliophaga]
MSFYGSWFFGDIIQGQQGRDIIAYHGFVMMVMIAVLVMVLYMGTVVLVSKATYRYFLNRQRLEFWWTLIPMILLTGLWFPSMKNLYVVDEVKTPRWNFKAVGKQWYWSYEFCPSVHPIKKVSSDSSDWTRIIDSYMMSKGEVMENKGYRLLDVDNRMVAPAGVQMTCYVTSSDVLHSFALPKLLLKVDAIPGRINRLPMKVSQSCVLYGQCSEICGVNHSFMPIVIEFIPEKYFVKWMDAHL